MELTTRLAYSQLKINRSRSIWTLVCTVLSAILITLTASVVTSGISITINAISSAFRISAIEQQGQFSILKSVGATKQ